MNGLKKNMNIYYVISEKKTKWLKRKKFLRFKILLERNFRQEKIRIEVK